MKNLLILVFILQILVIDILSQPCINYPAPTFEFQSFRDIWVPYQNGVPVPSYEKQSARGLIDLRSGASNVMYWRKMRINADHDLSLNARTVDNIQALIIETDPTLEIITNEFDDGSWLDASIPGAENDLTGDAPEAYYNGVWYRCRFTANSQLEPKAYRLNFYAVNYVCDVWLNGNYLGYHEGGYTPFSFDVSDYLIENGENILVIRVDNPDWFGIESCGPGYPYHRTDMIPTSPFTDWFNYTGIVHDVYIEVYNQLSVVRADVYTSDVNSSNTSADINTKITAFNKYLEEKKVNIYTEVYKASINQINEKSEYSSDLVGSNVLSGMYGNVILRQGVLSQIQANFSLSVNDYNDLWYTAKYKYDALGYAKLYILKVTIADAQTSQVYDEYYTQFGIRKVHTSGYKVFLNNKPVFLTGINRHEQHPDYGRTFPKDALFNELKMLRDDLHVNWMRTAHYPNHPYTYLFADRLGIAIMEEIPQFWQEETPWVCQNFGSNPKNLNYQMFREMVFKDFNRPCILQWSLCNENGYISGRENFINGIRSDFTTYDYTDQRLIGQNAGFEFQQGIPLHDPTQDICDYTGWSFYNLANGPATLETLHSLYCQYRKPVLCTEWGVGDNPLAFNFVFDACAANAPVRQDGSYNPCGYVMGVTYWSAFDTWTSYLAPWWDSSLCGIQSLQVYGVYDQHRNPKYDIVSTMSTKYMPYFNRGGITEEYINTNCYIECDDDKVLSISQVGMPGIYELLQNYPNPFNPSTDIVYNIPFDSKVVLTIYDILGREVLKLVNSEQKAGRYKAYFDGRNYASGLYIYRIEAVSDGKHFVDKKKMVLLK